MIIHSQTFAVLVTMSSLLSLRTLARIIIFLDCYYTFLSEHIDNFTGLSFLSVCQCRLELLFISKVILTSHRSFIAILHLVSDYFFAVANGYTRRLLTLKSTFNLSSVVYAAYMLSMQF